MKVSLKITVLLMMVILAMQVTLFTGCGNTDFQAPYGSVVVINPDEVEANSPFDTVLNFTAVVTSNGVPVNKAHVFISGGFAIPFQPDIYQFYRYPNGNNVPNVPVDSGFEAITDELGNYHFSIVAFGQRISQLLVPTNNAFTTADTGGSLAAGTYCYRVSALDATPGETPASPETCITVTSATGTSIVNLAWRLVTGATGYNVYGRTTGTETLIATLGAVGSYTDIGTAPGVATPPLANTTTSIQQLNTFTDNIQVRSGSSFEQVEVKFNAT